MRVKLNFLIIFYFLLQKSESRVGTDEDLKLSDLLRYYERDSRAALVNGCMCVSRVCTLAFRHDSTVRICCIVGRGALLTWNRPTRNWNRREQRTKACRRWDPTHTTHTHHYHTPVQAEALQQEANTTFEKLSAKGKEGVL